ncbi:LOW QUALITY PROTEIN: uncharacterized protein LOC114936764 [Nylanderia fulva]|uniref:LOW QUALITY PROTEIN: uncharacterized protein LOC114936764 n=1 Tax=Nylanderia fulva TaxID=613905 RepID=UPI0010FB133F|nr:LOW QUALITY PROTEIN: uncharacterized protein LOC114936764 [Nylanderia fulva]
MSTIEKAMKLDGKKRDPDSIKNKASKTKLGTISSETCLRPRFASHTLSSLMKTRTPMKKSSSRNAKASKKSQAVISSKVSRIYKRRSITKQSKSMQALMTILKWEKKVLDASSRQDRPLESTTAVCEYPGNPLGFLPNQLIKDISLDLKKCAASPAKSVGFHDEPAKVEELNDEEKEVTNSENREGEGLHSGSKSREPEEEKEDFSNEAQSHRQNVDDQYAIHRRNRKTWPIRKSETRPVHNSQDNDDRLIVNCAAPARKRGAFQKSLVFINQRVWRPPGVTRSSITRSTMSLTQPMSQKSSRSIDRAIASTENKFSSEHVETLTNESTNMISVNQSKIPMKENRDPCANRVTKICGHLAEAKQRQRLQNGGAIPKRRRSTTKVGSRTSNKRNNAKPTRSRSRSKSNSRNRQTSTESSQNWNEQFNIESTVICKRRSRPSEVIHALKEIINGVKGNEDVEENAVNVIDQESNIFNNKEDGSELQALPIFAEMSQNDEVNFTKDKNFDEPNQSFDHQSSCKSISTQTEESDSKKVLKLTQTQSSSNSSNVVEIGCNTMHYDAICKNAEVSCDLINLTNSKANSTIENKTPTLEGIPVHIEFIKHPESSTEDEYFDKSKKRIVSECKETLSTGTLELEDYDVMETISNTTNDFIILEKKIMNENSQTFSKSLINTDNKTNIDIDTHQESTKYFNDLEDNSSLSEKSHRPSSSMICDASCSSEELAEYLENDAQYRIPAELKENIPSDVIAALELAAERARNLRKAMIIYFENLAPREAEAEDHEIVERSECDEKYYPLDIANEDVDMFSTCSSKSSNSIRMCESELEKMSLDYHKLLNDIEDDALPREKAIVKSSEVDLEEVKSFVQLLMHRSEEEYALDLLHSKDEEDFEATGAIKTLALPTTNENTSAISYENLLPFIYCILFSVVFWYLQFSFQCKPAT